jgi:hypothetical protein
MTNPSTSPLEAETEADRLRFALTESEADLRRHGTVLKRLQGEVMASHLEVAGARSETVQFQGMLRRAEEDAAAAHRRVAALEAEIARQNAAIAALHAEVVPLRTATDLMRASLSWRISAPVRVFGRLARVLLVRQPVLRRAIQKLRGRPQLAPPLTPSPPPAAPPPPRADPNARYIFQPAPSSDDGTGVVTLDTLYHLSRSL